MTSLPMTVISGYLGAGKTTLINRLLAADHGMKLMVLVNDFGAINIDERLLASKSEDTIALTNGCVCCTMGADLFLALGDALDRRPRPDHLIVEASGVADPTRIANAALAEPEMRYAGIVTLVDGPTFEALSTDPLIGPQVRDQVAKADLVLVTKQPDGALVPGLKDLVKVPILTDAEGDDLLACVIKDPMIPQPAGSGPPHPGYISWFRKPVEGIEINRLRNGLSRRPSGLYRLKGSVVDDAGDAWTIQVVGQQIELLKAGRDVDPAIVGIGVSRRVTVQEIDAWWDGVVGGT